MRVLLCALTGFGNKVLDALMEDRVEVVAVLTRREPGPFPHYPEENLAVYAKEKGILVLEEFTWDDVAGLIEVGKPQMMLAATFHKIIPWRILNAVPHKINLHPSLLPKYKGQKPIEAALERQEKEIGLTAHVLTVEACTKVFTC